MTKQRRLTLADQFCLGIDQALRAILNNPKITGRTYPASDSTNELLSDEKCRHSAGLMRINHAGEVCAQALYHGQGLASNSPSIKQAMQQAAIEEGDHLAWCSARLLELGSHASYLNLIWYMGSFSIGWLAGIMGDRWSLGFLAETEKQVVDHLESHLQQLAIDDPRSVEILRQMQIDEALHREAAIHAGAADLPPVIKQIMRMTSKVMVKLAYYV